MVSQKWVFGQYWASFGHFVCSRLLKKYILDGINQLKTNIMCGGNGSVAHSIILQVNTNSIPIPPTTTALIDANCSFQGNSNGVTNENFVITVANTDTVTWSGVSTSNPATDTVFITDIDYEDGTNLFGNTDLKAPAGTATITGTVSNSTTTDAESYIIRFDVYNSGVLRGSYQIDPKIIMKT